ncbi:MAG: iron-sulfur cluster insertion protein ErpA [Candidatus Endolissoclinum sp.]|jgi:iron-sulfur cluster insertion protein|nr:iron-sulfur cluster insertion protein ErpA [Candidatus Endolissoclinum sp.]|tara:strand:- start:154 stop:474 length:321 start_codon:yes stop_codon:yes gene_type:complete
MIFTEDAAERVKEIIAEDNPDMNALRVFVQGGGCHGFSYGFGFEKEIADDDTVIETNAVKLVVDSMSIMYLNNATIDFIRNLEGERFTIDNPETRTSCGCGSSFSM